MLRFANFDSIFGFRNRWTFHPSRSITESSNESKQETTGNSPASEPNKRENSDQSEPGYKRVTKKYKCPTEPFYETLELIEKFF